MNTETEITEALKHLNGAIDRSVEAISDPEGYERRTGAKVDFEVMLRQLVFAAEQIAKLLRADLK